MADPYLESLFPRLRGTSYHETSPATTEYNCIAWAALDTLHWWEPDPFGLYFWPSEAPRRNDLDAYLAAFATLGYERCESVDLEVGFEKVVIYKGRDGFPSHVARQLHDGSWTSKLGRDVDILHINADDLEGVEYGARFCVLRRRVTS